MHWGFQFLIEHDLWETWLFQLKLVTIPNRLQVYWLTVHNQWMQCGLIAQVNGAIVSHVWQTEWLFPTVGLLAQQTGINMCICYHPHTYITNTWTHILCHRRTHSLKLRIWACALEPDHKVTLDHRFSPIRFNSLQYRELQCSSMCLLSTYKCAADFMWLTAVLFSWTKRFPCIHCSWTSLHFISGS